MSQPARGGFRRSGGELFLQVGNDRALPGYRKRPREGVESPTCHTMKTALLILLTTAWLASWTGIALGLSGSLAKAKPAPEQAVAVVAVVER